MKYIDSEKLMAEIERRRLSNRYIDTEGYENELLEIITSLQQEPRFPQYDNIVEKVFGAGNLEGWERDEAEMLVALAKEELLKSLQQEQPEVPSNLIDCDAVRDNFIAEVYRVLDADPTNDRANAIIDAFDSLPTVPQQPEVDLEKERKNLSPIMLTYAAEVFGGKTLLEDISYSYRQELADYFRDLAKTAKEE